jgi:hypothetical protein
MKPALILEGSGEELLAQAAKWKDRPRLILMDAPDPAEIYKDRLPPDVVWEGNVPLIPTRGRTEPITGDMVKEWLEEEA